MIIGPCIAPTQGTITLEARYFQPCDYHSARWCYRPELLPAPPCVYLLD